MNASDWSDFEPDDRLVRLGEWSVSLRGCELADVAFEGRRLLRGIRFVVRDHDWRTARNIAERVDVDAAAGVLELEARSMYGDRGVVEWRIRLTADGGTITADVSAKVTVAFRRNRVGLIVLQSPELAGKKLTVVHSDDSVDETQFPTTIAPHQPALDVSGYDWDTNGVSAHLRFAGDIFEMEDQRNWTDASYKTYSTPLSDPFPVDMTPGDVIEQSLTLTADLTSSQAPSAIEGADSPIELDDPFDIAPITAEPPTIQFGASTAPDEPAADARGPSTTILVEIPADEPCWPAVFDRALADASGGSIDVRIIFRDPHELAPVVAALRGLPVVRVGIFDRRTHLSSPELLPELRRIATEIGCEAVAGTRAHFTELNRSIDLLGAWEGPLTFSITPQMHDTSKAQLVESLAMQRVVAENAVRLAARRPLHIGPVTLRPRFNAVATSPFYPSTAGDVRAGYGAEFVTDSTDPRQHSPTTARWRQASIAALSVPGVQSVTYFEAWGPRGVVADRMSWQKWAGLTPA
ncbi:hypothetical protein [Spelaeicoccus albus]|uniref:Uncharacterized protein n=1 Tax=Spelaeicoccus albus TaxID=1280376 RepID=A0A7Z0AB62_9MICO|nr:hypothetical protein [Spelaeicoccus albus]NYI66961.1 hypothetical protein [Spelaeicoccus albus]